MRHWEAFCEWCGYTQSYRAMKAELKGATSTLSPAQILAMRPLISGPSARYPRRDEVGEMAGMILPRCPETP